MKPPMQDPTAGTRAREIAEHPESPQRIQDPLDPRYGELVLEGDEQGRGGQRVGDQQGRGGQPAFDPTNPECGDASA